MTHVTHKFPPRTALLLMIVTIMMDVITDLKEIAKMTILLAKKRKRRMTIAIVDGEDAEVLVTMIIDLVVDMTLNNFHAIIPDGRDHQTANQLK